MDIQRFRIWIARLLIGIVAILNLQCALAFLLSPDRYLTGFDLTGFPGRLSIQGMGLLFVMWNVPYLFAIWHPLVHRVSLIEAIIMQAIGLMVESILYLQIPSANPAISVSVQRFIGFDASGLVLLAVAWVSLRKLKPVMIKSEKP
ncbi:MAG: hypothetical protein ABFD44_02935 [Anaerolineaceae bacterium]